MCGIFGCLMRHGLSGTAADFQRANDIAEHRGPDGQGVVWYDTRQSAGKFVLGRDPVLAWSGGAQPTAMLAHRRLAIIDLSDHALQPMSNSDESVWITFNGEIYNFVELKAELQKLGKVFSTTSDTEVALRAYETWGPDCFERFLGMWAIGILDRKARRLILSRDRYGIKPLHYYADAKTMAFSSEIKQLLELPMVSRSVNQKVVYDYLKFEASDSGPETFFTGIRRLQPGHNLVVPLDGGDPVERRYYTPLASGIRTSLTPKSAAEEFRALLKDSIRIHLRADVPVGTCLSGGLDSSSIAMLMAEVARDSGVDIERHSFSCHFDTPEADELEFTKQSIAASKVIPHFVEPNEAQLMQDLRKLVWHQEEPFGSTSIYAQWCVFKLVHETGVKVVLDGQGADEMLGGYASTMPHFLLEQVSRGRLVKALWESWRWADMQGKPWHTQIPVASLKRAMAKLAGGATMPSFTEPNWVNAELEQQYAASSAYAANTTQRPFGHNGHFGNVLYQFFFLNNLPSLLRYEDRNSMAFSVEARVPFLDHRLVDFAFSLPGDLKVRDGWTKRVLRDAMEGTLPEPIRMRKRKMGFATPERRWQSGPLKGMVFDAIHNSKLAPYIRKKEALEHFDRVCNHDVFSFSPWRWLNLALWHEEFGV